MIRLRQGSNSPIFLDFDAPVEAEKIEVSLHGVNTEIKHWSRSEVTINENVVSLPLTEEETLEFPIGSARLSVKLLDGDGDVIFYDDEKVEIDFSFDKTKMED